MPMENLSKLSEICHKYEIALAYLFGSQAQNGWDLLNGKQIVINDRLADLDIGIVTTHPLPEPSKRANFYAALYNDLEDIFKPFPLDLVFLEENHSVFQAEAIIGVCVYQINEEKRDEYEMMILRHAADFRPFLETYLQEVLEELS